MRDPNKTKDKPHWPGWFYGPNGAAEIFQSADEVPTGWEDHPSKAAELEAVDIVEETSDNSAKLPAAELPPIKTKRPYRRKAA